MKNLILKVSLKYGLILIAINLINGLIGMLTFNPQKNMYLWISTLNGILIWIIFIACIILAHFKFYKKNEYYLSFKAALLIGFIIIGISFIISTIYDYFLYAFFFKDEIHQFYSSLSEKSGVDLNNYYQSIFLISALSRLFIEVLILFAIITVEAQWKIYVKAGKKGWSSVIPIYNIIVLLKIVRKPEWWIVFILLPFINIVFFIWITNLISKRFGKNEDFTIGLLFLPFIFYPLLGLSKVEYINE